MIIENASRSGNAFRKAYRPAATHASGFANREGRYGAFYGRRDFIAFPGGAAPSAALSEPAIDKYPFLARAAIICGLAIGGWGAVIGAWMMVSGAS